MWAKISWEDEVKDKQMNQHVLSPFWTHLFFLVQDQDLEAGLLTVGWNGTPVSIPLPWCEEETRESSSSMT